MYSFVRLTVNQLGHMSASGRRSTRQHNNILYSVPRRPAAVCNVLWHCPCGTWCDM